MVDGEGGARRAANNIDIEERGGEEEEEEEEEDDDDDATGALHISIESDTPPKRSSFRTDSRNSCVGFKG